MKKLTVLFAVLAMDDAYTMPAAADTQWDFYGSARVFTFSADFELSDAAVNVQNTTAGGDDSDRDTAWNMDDSRWGANVKVSDTLSGRVEWNVNNGRRLFYGVWNFGAGSLTVGQFWTPANFLISNQVGGASAVDGTFNAGTGLTNSGVLATGRDIGLMLTIADFKIALLQPQGLTDFSGTGDVDTVLPQIEASYHLALGKAFMDFAVGYQSYDVENTAANGGSFDVDSHIVAIAGGVDLGMFYVKGSAWLGQNVSEYALGTLTANAPTVTVTGGDNSLNDNDSMGLVLVAGVKASDMVTVETGVGYTESELDVTGSNTDDNLAWYVNAIINLAPGVTITPEIGIVDFGESAVDDIDDGDMT
ncbi:MAG: hypothetical protein GY694_23000, partial [Gammaproteobacteria bacterium]|nr:hypothetical protein [Gammaproteobacteria bacterium]